MKPPGELVRSDVARDMQPTVLPDDIEELVTGNTAFAVDAYSQLRQADGNLIYSPLSISIAMAMTYAGALGDTEEQMANVLHYTLPQDRLHAAFNWLDIELGQRGQGARGADGAGFRLNIVNALFAQRGYLFLSSFLDVLARNYGAGLSLLDFLEDTEGSRLAINEWVSHRTNGRIPDLLPPGSIFATTRLVLTNAVYFNAAWKTPFDPDATEDGVFHGIGGDVTVPMMKGRLKEPSFTEGEGYQAIAVPYDGAALDMVIIIPDEGGFADFEAALDSAVINEIFNNLRQIDYAVVTMPSFEFRFKASLVDAFKSLGLVDAFDDRADFAGMTGTRDLMITAIVHEAFIKVNEAGTEAAAATGVVIGETSVPLTVTIDRPFLFLIRDVQTRSIVFLGRVVDPSPE